MALGAWKPKDPAKLLRLPSAHPSCVVSAEARARAATMSGLSDTATSPRSNSSSRATQKVSPACLAEVVLAAGQAAAQQWTLAVFVPCSDQASCRHRWRSAKKPRQLRRRPGASLEASEQSPDHPPPHQTTPILCPSLANPLPLLSHPPPALVAPVVCLLPRHYPSSSLPPAPAEFVEKENELERLFARCREGEFSDERELGGDGFVSLTTVTSAGTAIDQAKVQHCMRPPSDERAIQLN